MTEQIEDIKQANLIWYRDRRWPLLPLDGKIPLTQHGFKDASLDTDQILKWHAKWPGCNWAIRTGDADQGGAGLVIVDIDKKNGGIETWDQLRHDHPESIETVTVRTGGGGNHLYFKYPAGHDIRNSTSVIGPGIDVRANGGYVVVPPSMTEARYTFEFTPADTPLQDLPEWILTIIDKAPRKAPEQAPKQTTADDQASQLRQAHNALRALSKSRAENYDQWLQVGMSLYSLGDDGLTAWDNWSKQAPDKYEPGLCSQKWLTFTPALTDASLISFASLLHWAEVDHAAPYLPDCPKDARPSHYKNALEIQGSHFSLNTMNDEIFVNGARMTDLYWSKVMNGLREFRYKAENYAVDAMNELALDNPFHPIKDYLESIEWQEVTDGTGGHREDHIEKLASHFTDKDNIFPVLLRRWLIGAVARIMGPRPGQQHPMLVLDGPQGIGKSRFVWWLGSPLPAFYIQSAITTDDKDFHIRLCSRFVWEVEELGATFRKSDLESLKSFLSREIVQVRVPYGKRDILKPATASFIGTLNNSGGFLNDPTGNRRFRVCTVNKINWAYDQMDVNQVWAQAVALFRAGEPWELSEAEQAQMAAILDRYEVDDPIAFDIFDTYNVDPDRKDVYTPTAQIIHRLHIDGKISGGSDQIVSNRIGSVLTKCGCESGQIRINGQRARGWYGVEERKTLP